MKHFIAVSDVPDINDLVAAANKLKANPLIQNHIGQHKRIGIIFLNPSLRTRLSTMIAAQNLGLTPIVLNMNNESWALEFEHNVIMNGASVEHIEDAAPILGQYFDIIGLRTFPTLQNREADYSEKILTEFINYTGVPVVSLESATLHPLQSLADTITIAAHLPKLSHRAKVVLTWAPHIKALPQCVANSFAQWMNKWDAVDLTIAHPEGMDLAPEFSQNGIITHNQSEALQDADFIYVKNWSSYSDYGKIYQGAENWMLTPEKLQTARYGKVMHCLPVRRNLELDAAIIDSSASLIQEQAGNRVWAAQAVLQSIIEHNLQ